MFKIISNVYLLIREPATNGLSTKFPKRSSVVVPVIPAAEREGCYP